MIPGSLAQTSIRKTRGVAPFDSTLIGNSVWLDGSADDLDRSTTSHSSTEVVMACWFQLTTTSTGNIGLMGLGTGTSGSTNAGLWFSSSRVYFYANGHGVTTNQLIRDIGWYHILGSWKLDESLASNKGKLFINGEEVTSFAADPRSSWGTSFGSTATQSVGSFATNTFLNGYIAQPIMLDGQSIQGGDVAITDFLDTYTFGTNGSQYIPKVNTDIAALATAAGGNSFCLDFANSADLGNDISSNNNDFTPNSMSSANQSTSTPSKVYATLNPLIAAFQPMGTASGATDAVSTASNSNINASMMLPSTGVTYWEIERNENNDGGGSYSWYGGIMKADGKTNVIMYQSQDGYSYYSHNGSFYEEGSIVATGSSWNTVGDKISFEFDADNGTLKYYKNNSLQRTKTGLNYSGGYIPFVARTGGSQSSTLNVKFKESEWVYTPPTSGALELVSTNLVTPDYQGIDYFTSTLYEGNGQNQRVGDFVPFTDTFTVANSAMFDDGDRRYLARTYTAGDPARSGTTCTISYWIKYCKNTGSQYVLSTSESGQTKRFIIYIDSSGNSSLILDPPGGGNNRTFTIPGGFLSEQEWINFVWQVDPSNATAADKVKAWVNGVQITSTDTSYQSASASDYYLFDNEEHFVGNLAPASAGYTAFCLNSYLAELNVLDGQLKSPTDFGQVDTSTNRWVPKDYNANVGTYGNRGFYMEFLNPTGTGNGVGTDTSGNGFNFTESFVSGGSAWATSDQFTDTPSKNYAIFSPKNIGSATATLSEGNLKYTGADNGGFPITIQPTSGKWYFEVELDTLGAYYPGLFTAAGLSYTGASAWAQTSSFVYLTNNASGAVYNGGTVVNGYNTGSMSASDRLGIAWDVDNNFIYYGLASGGSTTFFSSGDPTSGAAGTGAAPFTLPNERLYFGVVSGGTPVSTHHFISSGWIGAAPTGFLELNQDNLDDTQSKITAWAWIKNRDSTDSHILVDRVRGVGEVIHSNETAAETTEPNTVQRFLQRGVQVGSDVQVNTANESYVLWQWLMGDSATTGTVNNDGSIASTLIAADAGHLSIGTYVGSGANATIGHGLGGAPEMIIVKNRDQTDDWPVYHVGTASDPETDVLYLNLTLAVQDSPFFWNDTAPTTSVFSIGTGVAVNTLNENYVFYTFRSVPGVCKVGSYVGNLNADGPYIDLGFTPRWFMLKVIDGTNNWGIFDTARNTFNVSNRTLNANGSDVEDTTYPLDILSNGVKIRGAFQFFNDTGKTYVYMAMADIGGNGTLPPIYGR